MAMQTLAWKELSRILPITQTQVSVLGSADVTNTDAHALRNAGLSASGGGPVAAPTHREGNGSELVEC